MLLMWSGTDATGGDETDFQAWVDFQAEAAEAGVYRDGQAFTTPADARVVRTSIAGHELPGAVRPGTYSSGDVQLQAYYSIECGDLDEAVSWANRLPTYGEVEVRQILEY